MKDVKNEVFNAWLADPVSKAFVESIQQLHYAALVEQAANVAKGDMTGAQMTVGRLAMLDELLAMLSARPQAPKMAAAYPEAIDDAGNDDDDKFRDPGLNASGRNYVWTRTGLNS